MNTDNKEGDYGQILKNGRTDNSESSGLQHKSCL